MYLRGVLLDKASVVTRAIFWRVPHQSGRENIRLKIGRYNRVGFSAETLQATEQKSELTLDNEECRNLLQFIAENYEPFRKGATKYILLDESFDQRDLGKH